MGTSNLECTIVRLKPPRNFRNNDKTFILLRHDTSKHKESSRPVTPYFSNLILESVFFHVIVEFAHISKFQTVIKN